MGSFRRFIEVVAGAMCVVLLAGPAGVAGGVASPAGVAGWPLESQAETLVAFGERYPDGQGGHHTHRGVDLAAEPGSTVHAILEGRVAFAGRIPAGEGATTLAVTVESGDLRFTLMPLAELRVSSGEVVPAGAVLGVLAATGDRSCGSSHVHVSVRRGDLYLDPAPFLLPPVTHTTDAPEVGSVAPVAAPAPAPGVAPVPVPAAGAPAGAGSAVPAGTAVSASAPVSSQVTAPSGATSAAGTSVPAGAGHTLAAREAGGGAAVSAPGTSVATVRTPSPLPRPVSRVAAALELDEARVGDALVANRRAALLTGSPVPGAALLGAAALLMAALLWPVWRTVPIPVHDLFAHGDTDDVAAVVAR